MRARMCWLALVVLVVIGLLAPIQGVDVREKKEAANFRARTRYLEIWTQVIPGTTMPKELMDTFIERITAGTFNFDAFGELPYIQDATRILSVMFDVEEDDGSRVCRPIHANTKSSTDYDQMMKNLASMVGLDFEESYIGALAKAFIISQMCRTDPTVANESEDPYSVFTCSLNKGGSMPGETGFQQIDWTSGEITTFTSNWSGDAVRGLPSRFDACPLGPGHAAPELGAKGEEFFLKELPSNELGLREFNRGWGPYGLYTSDEIVVCDGKFHMTWASIGTKIDQVGFGGYVCSGGWFGGPVFNNYM